MLRFFRLNDPYRLLGLLILLLVLSLPTIFFSTGIMTQELKNMLVGEAVREGKLLYVSLFDSTATLSSLTFALLDWMFGRSSVGRIIFPVLLIFFQASFFAIILIRNKAYADSTYIPALIFGVLCCFSFDIFSASPELLGSTFLLMSINNLFKEIEFKIQRDEIILNLGFYLGLASLFIFSFSIFLIASIIILLVFTRINLRKYLLLLLGFLLPHVFLLCYYFYRNETSLLVQNFYLPNVTFQGKDFISLASLLVLLATPILFLFLSFFKLNTEGRFTKYQSQLSQVMLLWLVFCIIQVSITRELTPHSFIISIPSLAYFISHYFLLLRRKRLAEYIFGFLILSIVGIATASTFGKMPGVNYKSLFVNSTNDVKIKDKKILVIKDEISYYQSNKLAGYFLDWQLSKDVFDQPDYYENLILVRRMFDNDAPEIIIDPTDKMKAYFNRMPDVANRYKREGDNYTRILFTLPWCLPPSNAACKKVSRMAVATSPLINRAGKQRTLALL
jgi:hypothetical protein